MPGIEEVAELAGVSVSTASRAINGRDRVSAATIERVRQAALQLGYVRSSSAYTLATGNNRNIGVVLPHVDRWYFTAVLTGVESRLIDEGYDLTLYNLDGGPEHRRQIFDDFLRRKRVDALLTVALKLTDSELETLSRLEKPVFSIGGPVYTYPSLSIDDFEAARIATLHLLMLGHTKIAFIGADAENEGDFHHPVSRKLGFVEAMRESGVENAERFFIPSNFTIEGGYAAAKTALSDPNFGCTAIVAVSDETAFGAILAARDLGLGVPQDVSIVGIDGHDLAEFFGLTTVQQDPRGQGAAAANLLISFLGGGRPDLPLGKIWPTELKVRSSTARSQNAASAQR